tara:strand:- start:60 stop:890 length:831 start_codon:yes stop_codon:yes gene_type:complete
MSSIDLNFTKAIFNLINSNSVTQIIPWLFGLLPYEFYVIPGMYLAILQVVWLGAPGPIQFHLLPHWFSYCIFQLLKKSIKRGRPGCVHKDLSQYIDASHCHGKHKFQSFPSGHAGVASALAVALFMEMNYSEHPHFFEIPITSKKTQKLISYTALFVAGMICVHRISYGYHSVFDVVCGLLLGGSIGFISWTTLEYFKNKYNSVCEDNKDHKDCDNYGSNNSITYWLKNWHLFKLKYLKGTNPMVGLTRIIITIPIVFLLIKFLTVDVFTLSQIKH